MDFWLLGVGAVVLIGVTLWLVWPERTADMVGNSIRGEEVLDTPMNESERPTMSPHGERFSDQYTSATADRSAGAVESRPEDGPGEIPVTAQGRPVTPPTSTQRWPAPTSSTAGIAQPRTIGLGAGGLLMLGGGVGGAWLYARWQRERNKPINRLRRGAREVTSRLGERLPDVEELPQAAAPLSGAAAALLLTGLLASRMLRHDADRTEQFRDAAGDMVNEAVGRGRDAAQRGRKAVEYGGHEAAQRGREAAQRGRKAVELGGREAAKRGRTEARRLSAEQLSGLAEPRRPRLMGLGLGGMAIVATGSYLVWRLARGAPAEPKP